MQRIVVAMLVIAGAIQFAPVVGLFGADRLATLYGIAVGEPNLEILLRHRALLFGLTGAYRWWAAWRPAHRPTAFLLGFASMLGFLVIAWRVGGVNAALARVVAIDVFALACLAVGVAAHVASLPTRAARSEED
jgi:hypothetical protein